MNSISRNRMGASALAIAVAVAGISACMTPSRPSGPVNDQNWTEAERLEWYRGTQGSRLMPEKWLLSLEAKDSTTPFMAPANFARFNYLPPDPGESTSLPIGFAIDRQSDADLGFTRMRWFAGQGDREPWVGLNCSACHTAEMRFNGTAIRVDGGPGLGDLQGLVIALDGALKATFEDPAKWDRFAARVLAPQQGSKVRDTPENRGLLRGEFEKLLKQQMAMYGDGTGGAATSTASDYGHGRLDAVGFIFAKVGYLAKPEGQLYADPFAPVSYPFLWNINQHNYVQWNGIAPNKGVHFPSGETFDIGAMVRNTSEVIGVFADVQLRGSPGIGGFKSSVRASSLDGMEVQLGRLWGPPWPTLFGTPDPKLVRDGHNLFREQCAGCHVVMDRKDTKTPIIAQMTPIWGPGSVGTDPWMACNSTTYQAFSGVLEGTPDQIFRGDPLPRRTFTASLLTAEAIGVMLGKKWQIIKQAAYAALGFPRRIQVDVGEAVPAVEAQDPPAKRLQECKTIEASGPPNQARLIAYKGRPLQGIWATAPYLHNGSVKSLWELMLPPDKRDGEFWVGNREFDPKNVGYVDAPTPAASLFRVNDGQGKPIPGNANEGHDYGNSRLSDEDRWALVEYMKTL